jgi:hypothetical protein
MQFTFGAKPDFLSIETQLCPGGPSADERSSETFVDEDTGQEIRQVARG